MIDKNILDDNSKAMDELSEGIYQLLLKKGYKLEVGSKCNATYGKGSKIGRVLLGAFIKRFVFSVKITSIRSVTTFIFAKDGKGYMGGAIGAAQVKQEYKSIISLLENYHIKTTEE